MKIAVPNAETNIFAVKVDVHGTKTDLRHEIIIWDDNSAKVVTRLACDSDVINCYFARNWFIVGECSKIVAYDQKNGFQKIILFGFMNYSFSTMKFVEHNFIFAFVSRNHPEINLLLLSHDFNDYSFAPFPKQSVGIINYSIDAKFIVCTTDDCKHFKIFSANNLKTSLYTGTLSGKPIIASYLICEYVVLMYYSNNEFELIDLSKKVTSYLFFTTYLSIIFKPKELLCLYELNKQTKPIVSYVIDYYDKVTKSIKAITLVC